MKRQMPKILYNTTNYVYDNKDIRAVIGSTVDAVKANPNSDPAVIFARWFKQYEMNHGKVLTAEAACGAVADVLNVDVDSILNVGYKGNEKGVMGRRILGWFVYTYTLLSHQEVADFMGWSDHTSSLHAFNKVNGDIQFRHRTRHIVYAIKLNLLKKGYALKEDAVDTWKEWVRDNYETQEVAL